MSLRGWVKEERTHEHHGSYPRGFTHVHHTKSLLLNFAYGSRMKETPPAKGESWQQLLKRSTRTFDLLPCPGLHQSQAHPEGRHEPFVPAHSREETPQKVDAGW